MLRIWGSSPDGLNAEFAITPEIGFHPFRYETDLKSIGTSFGIALYDRSVSAFVAVDAVSITRGILINGGVKELAQSDNIDVVAIRSSADVQSRVFFEFSGISPLENPASFEFSIESAVFARSQVDQSIDLFNFDSNSWEEVYVGIASPFVDDELLAEAGGDLSRFVQSGTRTIEARCRYQSVNPRQQFSANVDRALWVIR